MLWPALNTSSPPVPLGLSETIDAFTTISLFACSTTLVPRLVCAVMVAGVMVLSAPGLSVNSLTSASAAGAPLAASMVRFKGSSSRLPALPPLPAAALASTVPANSKLPLPDTSTWPPSPPPAPPRAAMLPWKALWPSAHTTTVPPAPTSVALASILAWLPTLTWLALAMPASAPCRPPPTRTAPPPLAPLASSALSPNRPTRSALRLMLPPLPRRLELRSWVAPSSATVGRSFGAGGRPGAWPPPATLMAPPPASPLTVRLASCRVTLWPAVTATLPPCPLPPSAATLPLTLTSPLACSATVPPPAPVPLTSMLAPAVCTMPCACRAMLPPAPAGSAAAAPAALMLPLLTMAGAVRLMLPAGLPSAPPLALMTPLFSILSPASSTIRPPFIARPVASRRPVFFTTAPCRRSSERADSTI